MKEFARNVLKVKRVSDRLMSLNLEMEGIMMEILKHKVTYKSGGRSAQVNYILWRHCDLKEISDCKVVGEISWS